jgi:hypothetical protein
MVHTSSIDVAGTPRPHHLFAVFDDDESCQRAEYRLYVMEVQTEELHSNDATELEHPATRGVLGRIERFFKGLGGESHMATIYAHHLQRGRVLLSVPVSNSTAAAEVTRVVTDCGGYEVTYFRGWSIQYMSPSQNLAHDLPTHSTTNRDE